MRVTIWKQEKMAINSVKKVQIKAKYETKAKIEALLFDKNPMTILIEYSNYNKIFSAEYTAELLEYTKINDHAI